MKSLTNIRWPALAAVPRRQARRFAASCLPTLAKRLLGLVFGFGFVFSVPAQMVPAAPATTTTTTTTTAPPQPPPPEAFFSRPTLESARLSPSGQWLAVTGTFGAVVAANQTRVGVLVFDLKTMKPSAVVARFSDADIGGVTWVNDEWLVFSVQDNRRGGADQPFWPGLYSVRRDGTDFRQLVRTDASRVQELRLAGREPLDVNHQLLHVPRDGSTDVLVGEWLHAAGKDVAYVNAKRLDVSTGRTRNLSFGAPPDVRQWLFDAQGHARLVYTRNGARGAYHWRDGIDTAWRVLAEFDTRDAPWQPSALDDQARLYVTVSRGEEGASQLHTFDFTTGKPAPQPLVSTPGFDLQGGLVTETPGSPALGVRVLTDAETTVWFDERLKMLQRQADERLPGHINRITCSQCQSDDITALVYSWSDRDPGQYTVYRGSDKKWQKVSDLRPGLNPRRMGTTRFDRVRTRDGLEMPVWVTQPAGPAVAARPAVVLVHGGPWVRGRNWGWSADAQFLASRGYVVIEPEFRGSRGYGQRLYRAGWRQWGGSMQDDLVDALQWAVGKGWVDKNRVCIAGASYGGYATLMGLVKNPELWKCGVAWVAVTDPRLMFKWTYVSDQPDEVRAHDYRTLIGDPVADLAKLEAAAPVLHAKAIKAPVLMAVGVEDRRVPLEHGQRMRAALTEAGNPPLWLAYPDEGHGFFLTENRVHFMRQVENFLAQHLAPK